MATVTVDPTDKEAPFDRLCNNHETAIYNLKHGIPIEELYINLALPSVIELISLLEEVAATVSSNNDSNDAHEQQQEPYDNETIINRTLSHRETIRYFNSLQSSATATIAVPPPPTTFLRKLFITRCYPRNEVRQNLWQFNNACQKIYVRPNYKYYDYQEEAKKRLQKLIDQIKDYIELENRLYQSIITLLSSSSSSTDLQCFGIIDETNTAINPFLHDDDTFVSFMTSILRNHQSTEASLEHFYYVQDVHNLDVECFARRCITMTLPEYVSLCKSSPPSAFTTSSNTSSERLTYRHSLLFNELSKISTLKTITLGNSVLVAGSSGADPKYKFLNVVLKLSHNMNSNDNYDGDDNDSNVQSSTLLLPPSLETARQYDYYVYGEFEGYMPGWNVHPPKDPPPPSPLTMDDQLAIDEIMNGMKEFLQSWHCCNSNKRLEQQRQLQPHGRGVGCDGGRIGELCVSTSSSKALDVCLEQLGAVVAATTISGGDERSCSSGNDNARDRVGLVWLERLTLDLVPPAIDFTHLGGGTVVNPPNWYWTDRNVIMKICDALRHNNTDSRMAGVAIKAITLGLYNVKNVNTDLEPTSRLAGQGYNDDDNGGSSELSLEVAEWILKLLTTEKNHIFHDIKILRINSKYTWEEAQAIRNMEARRNGQEVEEVREVQGQEVDVVNLGSTYQNEIDYYMKLNRIGRGGCYLPSLDNRDGWIGLIMNNSNDPDAIYYLLKINPGTVLKERSRCSERKKKKKMMSSSIVVAFLAAGGIGIIIFCLGYMIFKFLQKSKMKEEESNTCVSFEG